MSSAKLKQYLYLPRSQLSPKPKVSLKRLKITVAIHMIVTSVVGGNWMGLNWEVQGQRDIWTKETQGSSRTNQTQFITITNTLLRSKEKWWLSYPNPNFKLQPVMIQTKTSPALPKTRGATKIFAKLVPRKNMPIIKPRTIKSTIIWSRKLGTRLSLTRNDTTRSKQMQQA